MDVIPELVKEPVLDEEGKEIVPEEAEEPIVLNRPNDPNDWSFWNEKCYVRINQYRESGPVPTEEPPKDKKSLLLA
jgi:hypothetical protein